MAQFSESAGVLKTVPWLKGINDFRWILWPVYAWKVVVPISHQSETNIFQRAVLKLIRAGVFEVAEMATRLSISVELAALVTTELIDKRYVRTTGTITERGVGLLDDLSEQGPEELKVMFVFTDARTGEIWPLMLEGDLPFESVARSEQDYVVFLSGTTGAPKRDSVFEIRHGQRYPESPTPESIVNASKRQDRRLRNGDEAEFQVGSAERVGFVDQHALPVHFATRVFANVRGEMVVQNPYNEHESPKLLRLIQQEMDQNNGLKNYLAKYTQHDPNEPTLGSLQNEAEYAIRERFTLKIERERDLFEYLAALKRAQLEMELDDAPVDKLDDFMLKAQKVLEHVMSEWKSDFSVNERLWKQLSKGDKPDSINTAFLAAKAEEAGFDLPLPSQLTGVKWGKVNNARNFGGSGLRASLILNILSAAEDAAHPLRKSKDPRLLHRLDSLAGHRDTTSHANERPDTIEPTEHLKTVFDIIDLSLERK